MSTDLLAEASDALDEALDLQSGLEAVAGLAVPSLADFCAIDVLSVGDALVRVAAPRDARDRWARGVEAWFPALADGDHPIARVLREGHPQLVADARAALPPPGGHIEGSLAPASYLVVPLAARGQRLGALSLVSWTPAHRYRTDDLRLAVRLARQLSLAVDNRQLAEEIWDFLAVLSHELRTPLTAMHGWVSLLRRHDLTPAQVTRGLDVIERNTRLQARLLDDLLELARLRSGSGASGCHPTDLELIVRHALASMASEAAHRHVQVRVESGPAGECVVDDTGRLQQLVEGVLAAALADTLTGASISVALTRPLGSTVYLTVRRDPPMDRAATGMSGVGRGSSSGERARLGVGLLVARRLAEMHGGRLELRRDEGDAGFVVRVALPSAARSLAGDGRLPRPPEAHGVALEGRRVLVIEDDADTREFLRLSLERRGAVVRVAASGAEALRMLDRSPVDAVLSDLTMPDGDGFSVMRAIRARGMTRLPAVALSALNGPTERAGSAAAGFAEHLRKPVEAEHLARTLARVIQEADVR